MALSLDDSRPIRRMKPEDTASPDVQALVIDLAELAQHLGAEAVMLLHAYQHSRDLIETTRRARVHASEIHTATSHLLDQIASLSKALRAAHHYPLIGAYHGR